MKHTGPHLGNDAEVEPEVMAMATAVDPKRSAMMARIGQRNTAPEIMVRRLLHHMGYRFRLHRRDLPGTPDIVLPRHQVAVLVHGCFWHRHPNCQFAYTPKTRLDFWTRKFEQNVERDQRTEVALKERGWTVVTIWECETADSVKLNGRLRRALGRLRSRG
jgi:DNA mismatch endonuclease, patch repair protein